MILIFRYWLLLIDQGFVIAVHLSIKVILQLLIPKLGQILKVTYSLSMQTTKLAILLKELAVLMVEILIP
jgi:hypothetical protein